MKLSPSPDESWELRFNIIENKTCQSSIIYDYSKDTIIDLQDLRVNVRNKNIKLNNYIN
ncbi:hypothetical protein H8356DRAFT_1362452 [Neocallimastix lanati (nom. inval.)]|nr:hypothetical protein H8356DRAFT_1362452 [Neocallimastix sp. JGI-2020a]